MYSEYNVKLFNRIYNIKHNPIDYSKIKSKEWKIKLLPKLCPYFISHQVQSYIGNLSKWKEAGGRGRVVSQSARQLS